MVQTKAGAQHSDWIAFMRVCGQVWRRGDRGESTNAEVRERMAQLSADASVLAQLRRGELNVPCCETLELIRELLCELSTHAEALAATKHMDSGELRSTLEEAACILSDLINL